MESQQMVNDGRKNNSFLEKYEKFNFLEIFWMKYRL
jgi:hypothetical protein